MAIVEVKVPQLSESVAEATLLQWKKKPGEAVAMDEILIEIETDKVVLEVPAPAAGVLAQIVKADGESCVSDEVIAASTPKARPRCSPLAVKRRGRRRSGRRRRGRRPPAAARPAWPCPPPPS